MPNKKLKGGGEKINNLIYQLFSKDKIEFLPLSSIFLNNISHKYIHMVSLHELRNIIDNNQNLKRSEIIMNIYNNKKVISLNDIYNNIELTMLNTSLEDNVKILFQHITDYNINKYVKVDTDLYSVITCNDEYDDAYETEINMKLLNKMFDMRDLDDLINNTKQSLLLDTTFRELVVAKMKKCSEKPYSLMDLFTGEISFDSNKKCEIPNNKLLRLNNENLIFLSENVNNLSYGDKMKLLILFEHRLTLLSKYFSLEILRRKNVHKSIIINLLNKILQLDISGNKRRLTAEVKKEHIKELNSEIKIQDNIQDNVPANILVGGDDPVVDATPDLLPPPTPDPLPPTPPDATPPTPTPPTPDPFVPTPPDATPPTPTPPTPDTPVVEPDPTPDPHPPAEAEQPISPIPSLSDQPDIQPLGGVIEEKGLEEAEEARLVEEKGLEEAEEARLSEEKGLEEAEEARLSEEKRLEEEGKMSEERSEEGLEEGSTEPGEPFNIMHKKSTEKISLEEIIGKKLDELFSSGKIKQIIDEETSKVNKLLNNGDIILSDSKKLAMSDKCGELKNRIMNDKLDVDPDMMDMLNNCNNIDVKSGINHRSNIVAASAGGGHNFF